MEDKILEIIKNILAVAAGLGLTGIAAASAAYWIFKLLAKSWIDAKIQSDLEAARASNLREAERLKAELGRYADRATKFHIREYEVLPEAWGLMNKAYGICSAAISVFQESADLERMSPEHLETWLEDSGLKDFQKNEIRKSQNKNDTYSNFYSWKQISDAKVAIQNFQNYVILQGVFIDEDLSDEMIESATIMHRAIISRTMAERTKGFNNPGQHDFWVQAYEILQPAGTSVQSIKNKIRDRLSDIKAPVPGP